MILIVKDGYTDVCGDWQEYICATLSGKTADPYKLHNQFIKQLGKKKLTEKTHVPLFVKWLKQEKGYKVCKHREWSW